MHAVCSIHTKISLELHFCWYFSDFTSIRFNQYLQAVGSDRQVWSFGVELADGVAWCTLLNAIDPASCPPPEEQDPETNAINIISAVENMGIKVRVMLGEGRSREVKEGGVLHATKALGLTPFFFIRMIISDSPPHGKRLPLRALQMKFLAFLRMIISDSPITWQTVASSSTSDEIFGLFRRLAGGAVR